MSVTLNGSTGYLEWNKGAGTMPVTAYPFSIAVRLKSATNASMFAAGICRSDADRNYAAWFNFGGLLAYARSPGLGYSASTTVDITTTKLVIVTFDSATRRTVAAGSNTFVVDTNSISDQVNLLDRIVIGCQHYNSGSANNLYTGEISEVHFFNRALAAADYDTLAADYKPELMSGWQDGWSLKDASDLTSLGGSRTLTLVGGVTSTGTHPITRTPPDTTAPTLTGAITIGTVTANSIGMSWPVGGDNVAVTSYEVSKDGGSTWTDTGSTGLSYNFTGLTSSTSYALRVRAKDAANNVSTPALAATQSTNSSGGATAVTMTGPSTGSTGAPSTNFTVGANGAITGTVTVTPSDGGGGGTFTPTTVNISAGTPTATFTYTPSSVGAKTISATNNGGLTNPSNLTYTATAVGAFTNGAGGALSRNSGAAVVSVTLSWLTFLNDATGAFVVTKTNVAVNGSGIFSTTDGSLVAGTTYRAIWKESTGERGQGWAVAT